MSDLTAILDRFGTRAIIGMALAAILIWLLAHLAAAPGGEVSVLFGLVSYTKSSPGGGRETLTQQVPSEPKPQDPSEPSQQDPVTPEQQHPVPPGQQDPPPPPPPVDAEQASEVRDQDPDSPGPGAAPREPEWAPQKLSDNGFEFLLEGCRPLPSEFACYLKISNTREDRRMYLLARSPRWGTSSFLYDGSGTEHSATRTQIGDTGEPRANFITGIEYDAAISFQGVPSGVDRLPVLDIGYVVYLPSGASDGGIQRVKFREVPLIR